MLSLLFELFIERDVLLKQLEKLISTDIWFCSRNVVHSAETFLSIHLCYLKIFIVIVKKKKNYDHYILICCILYSCSYTV